VSQRYDDRCGPTCRIDMTIPNDMTGPVFFYYSLTNFYQNHRRYVKSRADDQLSGAKIDDYSPCDPLSTTPNGVGIYPCGLIANSMFNDTFQFARTTNGVTTPLQNGSDWTDKGIAWQSDLDKKFSDPGEIPGMPGSVLGYSQITRNLTAGFVVGAVGIGNNETFGAGIRDEHFVVWMRTAGLPTFKKLWAKFPAGFKQNDIVSVYIVNNYKTSDFSGQKALVLSTTSWIGGKNDFLGIAYLTVGCLCVLLGLIFLIKHLVSPRPLGDMHYLNWPGAGATAPSSSAPAAQASAARAAH